MLRLAYCLLLFCVSLFFFVPIPAQSLNFVLGDSTQLLFNNADSECADLSLPVSTFEDLINYFPGAVTDYSSGDFTMRDVESSHTLFQYDNLLLRDPRNNDPLIHIPLSAIERVTFQQSGVDASYGQMHGGLVLIKPKEGNSDKYSGTFTMHYAPPASKHFGSSIYDEDSYFFRPFLDDDVCWTGTDNGNWDRYQRMNYPSFNGWYAESERAMIDDNPNNDFSAAQLQRAFMWNHRQIVSTDQPDYIIDAGFGGPLSIIGKRFGKSRFYTAFRGKREMLLFPTTRDDYKDYTWTFRLNLDLSSRMKLSFDYIQAKESTLYNNFDFDDRMETTYQLADFEALELHSAVFSNAYFSSGDIGTRIFQFKLDHQISEKIQQMIRIAYLKRSFHAGPPALRDTTRKYEIFPDYRVDEYPMGYWPDPSWEDPNALLAYWSYFALYCSYYDTTDVSDLQIQWQMSKTFSKSHQLKGGIDLNHYGLNFDYASIVRGRNVREEQSHSPLKASFYINDNYRFKELRIKAGIRLDVGSSRTDRIDADPFNRNWLYYEPDEPSELDVEKAKYITSFNPRITLTQNVFNLFSLQYHYGHYSQFPDYEQTLKNLRYEVSGRSFLFGYGNPNLTPSVHKISDFSLWKEINKSYAVKINYYLSTKNKLTTQTQYQSISGLVYNQITNYGNEKSNGCEISLIKRGHIVNGLIEYSRLTKSIWYSKALAVYEDPMQQRGYDRNSRWSEKVDYKSVSNLYASLQLNTSANSGFQVFHFYPFSKWSACVVYQWHPGEYVTYNPAYIPEVFQNLQMKDFHDVTIRLSKTFRVQTGVRMTMFCDIYNALNTKRLSGTGFSNDSDYYLYMGSLHLPESESQAYSNIPGNDRLGDYREDDVAYQPIQLYGASVEEIRYAQENVIYCEKMTGRYMEYKNEQWSEVDHARMKKILDNKAYIDMPDIKAFTFLNPRKWVFGLSMSFEF